MRRCARKKRASAVLTTGKVWWLHFGTVIRGAISRTDITLQKIKRPSQFRIKQMRVFAVHATQQMLILYFFVSMETRSILEPSSYLRRAAQNFIVVSK